MAKRNAKPAERKTMTPEERLGLRVSAMINSPIAQLNRRVTIHQLDDDPEETWEAVMEVLAETDGLEMIINDDETVTLQWEKPADDDQVVERGEVETEDEAAPF